MNKLENSFLKKASNNPKKIVFPESDDPRILKAVSKIVKLKIAKVVLLGNVSKVLKKLKQEGINWKNIEIIDPEKPPKDYSKLLYKLRRKKGLGIKQAAQLAKNPMYFGVLMVKAGDADGLVAGATHPTADTFRPALQIVKTEKGIKTASTFFIMNLKKETYIFSDCALNINPDAEQLAEIALCSAESAKRIGLKPKVAMLSFSTKGSGRSEEVEKVRKATEIAKKKNKKLVIDGEIQVDAAIVQSISRMKSPNSPLKGKANVLVFPTLDAGNISYKLVQRLCQADAIGPITQGLSKPINDLSRGCSVDDIVMVTALTVIQAQK